MEEKSCDHYHGVKGNSICDDNVSGACPKNYQHCCEDCEERYDCKEYCDG